jgi:hypothetical protein
MSSTEAIVSNKNLFVFDGVNFPTAPFRTVFTDGGNFRTATDSIMILGTNSDQHLRFRAGGSTDSQIRMTILSSGEVGIGTTIAETAAAGNGGLRIKNNLLVNGSTTIDTLNTSTADNSVIVEASGLLNKRTINSRVWDTNATFLSGSPTTNAILKSTGSGTIGNSTITDDGTTVTVRANTNITGTLSASNFRTPDSSNIGVGINALVVATGANNTAVGTNALAPNTTGANNTAVGVNALPNNQTGSSNTAVGVGALETNVSANNNTAFGCNALKSNTDGVNNVGVGISALHNNTTGYNSTAVGQGSLFNCTDGHSNAALGLNAGLIIQSGTKNTMLGTQTDVDAQARNSCVVIGANTISPAVDGSLAIGGTSGDAMGNLVTSSSTGTAANKDLIIYLNGVRYYIALKT